MELDADDALADMHGGEQLLEPVKRIFFDFDLTISRCHVFKMLAGWEESSVPPPFALTDRGQISKITTLNAQGPCWAYDEASQGIIPVGPARGEPWTKAALGGARRVEVLRSLFRDLRAEGVGLTILTKGYVGAVKKLLLQHDLLYYFDSVMGFTGKYYGDSDYDKSCEASKLEGDEECVLSVSKAALVRGALECEGLTARQAVLVEDDKDEVASVRQPQICRAIFVRKRQGMTAADMQRLRCLACCPVVASPASTEPLQDALGESSSNFSWLSPFARCVTPSVASPCDDILPCNNEPCEPPCNDLDTQAERKGVEEFMVEVREDLERQTLEVGDRGQICQWNSQNEGNTMCQWKWADGLMWSRRGSIQTIRGSLQALETCGNLSRSVCLRYHLKRGMKDVEYGSIAQAVENIEKVRPLLFGHSCEREDDAKAARVVPAKSVQVVEDKRQQQGSCFGVLGLVICICVFCCLIGYRWVFG